MRPRFNVDNSVLWDVSRIIHEADLADQVCGAPEGRGLNVV
ncbi:MAG: hypothetical protein ACYCTZ_14120 [Candidatus Dormibacteria bacterium]